MTDVTVLPMVEISPKPGKPLAKMMNERLNKIASELQVLLIREFHDERYCEDLIIYMSYNSGYAIRWKIVNDVPGYIQNDVARICGNLGYIQWKELDLYVMKVLRTTEL
ncbi:hypothetical protein [Pedobacter sp. JY14-1]|uniref:hypothetical protein n=1 Tax=Pedobacter sp. JY14-1 TaxID=3034151 RepID=UPI0023E0F7B6|nr:hypothetical protein [Pedobacter sp. JY14-1]